MNFRTSAPLFKDTLPNSSRSYIYTHHDLSIILICFNEKSGIMLTYGYDIWNIYMHSIWDDIIVVGNIDW